MVLRTFTDKATCGGLGTKEYKGDGAKLTLLNVGKTLDPNWDYPWKQEVKNVAFMNSTCKKKKLDLYALFLEDRPQYFLGKESKMAGLNDIVKTMYNILYTYSIAKFAGDFDCYDYRVYEKEEGTLSLFVYYYGYTLISWNKERLLSGDFNCVTYLNEDFKAVLANPNEVMVLGKCIKKLIDASVKLWGDVPNFKLQGIALHTPTCFNNGNIESVKAFFNPSNISGTHVGIGYAMPYIACDFDEESDWGTVNNGQEAIYFVELH